MKPAISGKPNCPGKESHQHHEIPCFFPVLFLSINLGLPGETVTGLSEPGHPFPRPNVHERFGRVLAGGKPDLVFACYGMNDGIYYPFSDDPGMLQTSPVGFQVHSNRLVTLRQQGFPVTRKD